MSPCPQRTSIAASATTDMAEPLTFWRERPEVDHSRRDFLTRIGFTLAASALAGCSRGPVQQAIPFLNKPEEITPGVASWYATTCGGCSSACALLAKTRDGRPIKIEGNAESRLFGGGACAAGQATVLSLYDPDRARGPLWRGQAATWDAIDKEIQPRLTAAAQRRVVLLSGTITSPSTRALIAEWSSRFPQFAHIVYDPVSFSGLREATRRSFGTAAVPHFRFDEANTIVSLDADFLGTWLSPVEFTRQYASRRRRALDRDRIRHYHFEAGVSLTGSNADRRVLMTPSAHGATAFALLRQIAARADLAIDPLESDAAVDVRAVAAAADDLWRDRGHSVVVSGSNEASVQVLVHGINALLGNVGSSVDLDAPSLQKQGDDSAVAALVDDMERGDVHALLVYGVNPVYDYGEAARFVRAMESVALTVSFADRVDETAAHCDAVCPDHHFLEAWGDAEPVTGLFSLAQPTIAPLFDTRSAQDSLLAWLGRPPDFYGYIRETWRRDRFPTQARYHSFDEFWDHTLHDGVFETPRGATAGASAGALAHLRAAWREAASDSAREAGRAIANRHELHLYQTVALGDGRHSNNPWLQELPDPVTKVTWGNFVAVSSATAARLGVETGDVLRVSSRDQAVELPAFVQPGQSADTVSIALGYGRERAGRVGTGIGANAFRFASARIVALTKTGRQQPLAATQTHHSVEGRPIVRTITRDDAQHDAAVEAPLATLYPPREGGEHHWAMAVDLNACTGCSACVTACQAENNVPVVGADEVRRGREMHWIRVDRYYAGDDAQLTTAVQPMMCQHCENAPCETVCPVLATVHSSDGINQQIYNRCVGTRYCENNCPYKVRRFNWFQYAGNERFDYTLTDPLERMVLNPDVVVRARGVMEKCSLCVQRIQTEKLAARREGQPLADGRIQTACGQSCPADAIVFGDLNDPDSRVSKLRRSRRHYTVLEELGTRPNVGYLMRVVDDGREDTTRTEAARRETTRKETTE
jgi:Fe-S-cluster-containing dehydrogenase component/anaerobic selenocysteine-containing dehydrogenase